MGAIGEGVEGLKEGRAVPALGVEQDGGATCVLGCG